jgi:tRNA-splicing ligase RtcB
MKIYGVHDVATVQQLERCAAAEMSAGLPPAPAPAVLLADGHLGYSMPIGGVVAYREHVSPTGVGYDIACGVLGVQTNLRAADVPADEMPRIADAIEQRVSFGIGHQNASPVDDHPVFDDVARSPVEAQRAMLPLVRQQLGTVGSGNHYVDVVEDEGGWLWVGVHFGSRGFGHRTATGFINLAAGKGFGDKPGREDMHAPPALLRLDTPVGQDYLAAMEIAGLVAYAGREAVVDTVLDILGATVRDRVHNHHNFAWREVHGGETYWVVRKGATPAFPGQRGFVGGSMGDNAVVLHGVESPESAAALYSTVHGAGRVLSRQRAKKGTHAWACQRTDCAVQYVQPLQPPPTDLQCPVHHTALAKRVIVPAINFRDVQDRQKARGIVLRGAGPDEAPAAYRRLPDVLAHHAGTIAIEHVLTPRIVVMAGADVRDPYRD